MPTVAKFVSTEVAAALKAAGYRRRGTEFAIEGPDGMIGVVSCRADNRGADGLLAINLRYGVVVPALLEYRESKGVKPFPFPVVDQALVWKDVEHPFPVVEGTNTWMFPYRWALPDEESSRLGELVRQALQKQVLPGVQQLFDTDVQVRWLKGEIRGAVGGYERTQAEVLAWLQCGPDNPRLQAAVAALGPQHAEFRKWLDSKMQRSGESQKRDRVG